MTAASALGRLGEVPGGLSESGLEHGLLLEAQGGAGAIRCVVAGYEPGERDLWKIGSVPAETLPS